MLKFSYEEILRRIEEKTGLPNEEIEEKINKKVVQLSDLVSKEGAAHIVANQLGIKLFENLNERKVTILEDIKKVEDAIRQIDEQRVSLQANLYALQGANQQIEFFINIENEEEKEDG